MKHNEERLNEWRKLFEERELEGKSIQQFCKEKNITPSQFYYYRGIISNPNKSKQDNQTQKITKTNVKPIQIIQPPNKENTGIRFVLPNSLHITLPRDMPVTEIKAILEVALSC